VEYRPLGDTDLRVSTLCLGTMTYGEQNTEGEAFAQLDLARDAGVNFVDVAEMYPAPPSPQTMGDTETIVGNWLRARKCRDQIVLASKVAGPGRDWLTYIRGGGNRLDRGNIVRAVEGSLQRLGTDCIDLYQVHWPDRETNFFGQLGYTPPAEDDSVPLLHTLEVMGDLVREGKIRHVGVSNETPWGVMEYLRLAERHDLPRLASIQNPYSLLNRSFDIGLAEVACREHVGLLAYSPLGFGVLSGKYLDGARPAGSRLARYTHYTRYSSPQAEAATAAYVRIAAEHGLDPAQMALAFVVAQPFTTSCIIGATTTGQLGSNLASTDLTLDKEVLAAIEAVHREHPNPAP
jgi:aryl-alcohol dehydrogenase-like predicted oxidoreductase